MLIRITMIKSDWEYMRSLQWGIVEIVLYEKPLIMVI